MSRQVRQILTDYTVFPGEDCLPDCLRDNLIDLVTIFTPTYAGFFYCKIIERRGLPASLMTAKNSQTDGHSNLYRLNCPRADVS